MRIARTVGWAAVGVLGAAAAAALLPGGKASGPDARIAFYEERLGGRASYPAHARLGMAYLQKFRETGRIEYEKTAERHLRQSFAFQHNFEALVGLASVSLVDHDFPDALDYARRAAATVPGHLDAQGLLFDATLALGDYDSAERIAGEFASHGASLATLARTASLREIRGDLDGAIAAMERACADPIATAGAGTAAWCHVRLGAMYLARCESDRAAQEYDRALARKPAFPLALEHVAELKAARGEITEASALYRTLMEDTGDPKYRMALADLHQLAGHPDAAARERRQAITDLWRLLDDGSNAQRPTLAMALLDDPKTAGEGLRLAEADWAARKDFLAADAIAWARLKNGLTAGAREAIEQALAPGVRAPSLLVRAGAIYAAAGEPARARELLQQGLACPVALWPLERQDAERALATTSVVASGRKVHSAAAPRQSSE